MIHETPEEGVEWTRDGARMTARVSLGQHTSELSYVLGQETDMPLMTGGEVVKVRLRHVHSELHCLSTIVYSYERF